MTDHAGKPCPTCGIGEVVELNLLECHFRWDAEDQEWCNSESLSSSEPMALWWECNHCLQRWPLSPEAREATRHSLQELIRTLE